MSFVGSGGDSSRRNWVRLLVTVFVCLSLAATGSHAVLAAHTDPATVATVSVGDGPQDVGVVPDQNLIYVATAGDGGNEVVVFDGASNEIVDAISVPDGGDLATNPETGMVYVGNEGDDSVSVIDSATNSIFTTIPVDSQPSGVAVNSDTNRIYVANNGGGTVSVIDGSTNTVAETISVGGSPTAVGVNPDTNKVYVANSNDESVTVIDGSTNTVDATISVGGSPADIAVNPDVGKVYVSMSSGPLAVIRGESDRVIDSVSISPYGRHIAVNPDTERVYVSHSNDGSVSVIHSVNHRVMASVEVGESPAGIAANPDTDRVYVANSAGDSVSVIANRPDNFAPTVSADAGSITVAEGDTATNTGTFDDRDGDTVTFSASVGTVTSDADGSWEWSYTPSDGPDQTQTVTITATDENSATATATFDLTVENVAPTVLVTGTSTAVAQESAVNLTAEIIDPGSADTHSATIDWGDGIVETVSTTGGNLSGIHSYDGQGEQTITVTVSDDDGATANTSVTVSVEENERPTVVMNYRPNGPETGETVRFTAEAHDVDGTVETAVWRLDGAQVATGSQYVQAFDSPGTYTVTLTVVDDDGARRTTSRIVSVTDPTPTPTPNSESTPNQTGGTTAFGPGFGIVPALVSMLALWALAGARRRGQ